MGSRKAAVLHHPAWTPPEQASRLLLYMLTYTKFCLMSMNRSRIPYFWNDCRSNELYFTHSAQGKGDGKLTVPPQSSPAVPLGCCNGSAVYPRQPGKGNRRNGRRRASQHWSRLPSRARRANPVAPMVYTIVCRSIISPKANSSGAIKRVKLCIRPMVLTNGPGRYSSRSQSRMRSDERSYRTEPRFWHDRDHSFRTCPVSEGTP